MRLVRLDARMHIFFLLMYTRASHPPPNRYILCRASWAPACPTALLFSCPYVADSGTRCQIATCCRVSVSVGQGLLLQKA